MFPMRNRSVLAPGIRRSPAGPNPLADLEQGLQPVFRRGYPRFSTCRWTGKPPPPDPALHSLFHSPAWPGTPRLFPLSKTLTPAFGPMTRVLDGLSCCRGGQRLQASFHVHPQGIDGPAQRNDVHLKTQRQIIVTVRHGVVIKPVKRQREWGQGLVAQLDELFQRTEVIGPGVIVPELDQQGFEPFLAGSLSVEAQDGWWEQMIQHRPVVG